GRRPPPARTGTSTSVRSVRSRPCGGRSALRRRPERSLQVTRGPGASVRASHPCNGPRSAPDTALGSRVLEGLDELRQLRLVGKGDFELAARDAARKAGYPVGGRLRA